MISQKNRPARAPPDPHGDDTSSWMSHHYGRVTGTKVPPGQGDAEAGMPSPDEESAPEPSDAVREAKR